MNRGILPGNSYDRLPPSAPRGYLGHAVNVSGSRTIQAVTPAGVLIPGVTVAVQSDGTRRLRISGSMSSINTGTTTESGLGWIAATRPIVFGQPGPVACSAYWWLAGTALVGIAPYTTAEFVGYDVPPNGESIYSLIEYGFQASGQTGGQYMAGQAFLLIEDMGPA
jgi:hypothetical protein